MTKQKGGKRTKIRKKTAILQKQQKDAKHSDPPQTKEAVQAQLSSAERFASYTCSCS